MKIGAEDRKKVFTAVGAGVVALGCLGYIVTTVFGGADATPTPAAAPQHVVVATHAPVSSSTVSPRANATARQPDSMDPSLHPEAMLLTESLVYSGRGRNIFLPPGQQPVETAAVPAIPKPLRNGRITPTPVVDSGPAGPPPIELLFFGVSTRGNGSRQAFFLRGDDVFIASPGDIVNRRYKVITILPTSVEVTDLTNNNTQRLPLATQ